VVGRSSRTRFIESAVSEGLELPIGGLRAAVPRFRQTGDRSSKIARELWRGAPGNFMGYAPNGGEHFAARNTLLFTSSHLSLQVLLQTVHPGIGMDPGIAQERRIEGEELFLKAGELQKPGAFGNEQPDGELHRGHALHDLQFHEPLE